jgi:hypothetical protein
MDSLQEEMVQENGCQHESTDCSEISLGILMRERHRINPPFVAPFNGYSLDKIVGKIMGFKIPMSPHCAINEEPYVFHARGNYHPCTTLGRLKPILMETKQAVEGVNVADFVSRDASD